MPPAGFEPAIPTGDRPQTLALDRSATGIGCDFFSRVKSVADWSKRHTFGTKVKLYLHDPYLRHDMAVRQGHPYQ